MPPNRNRPTEGGAAQATEDTIRTRVADTADVLAQLRRRRAAACRMPPVGDGPADPLDAYGRVPRSLPSTLAARRAWHHLNDHGLLSEHVEAVLTEGVA